MPTTQPPQFWTRYRAALIAQWRAAAAAEPGQLPAQFVECHLALIRAVEDHADLPRFDATALTAAHRRGVRNV